MARTGWTGRLASAATVCGIVVAAGCIGSDTGRGDAGGVAIVDSAGVTLVRFTQLAALDVPERLVTVTAEVGRQAGSELFRVSAARLLESGRLAIGNSGSGEILYVDADGRVVRRVGGEGEGPGEFMAITSFPDVRGDTLTVYDVRLGRLTVLDPAGEVVEIRTLEPPSRVVDLVPLAIGEDGSVLAVHGDARIFGQGGVGRDTTPLMLIHSSSAVDILGMWPAKEWFFASIPGGSMRTAVGFGRSFEASGRDGRAVVGSTDRLLLSIFDVAGDEVMRILGTAPNRPVPDAQAERLRADRLANLPDNIPTAVRTAIETAPNNETFPAFSGVLLGADGRIWIGATEDYGATNRRWTVFALDGRPIFRLVLPASATLLDAAGDRLVVLDRTELGEEIVRVLTLAEAR